MALLCAPWVAQAQQSLPYSYGFENNDLAAEGWTMVNCATNTGIISFAAQNGDYGFLFSYANCPPYQYLISPELSCPSGVTVEFAYKNYNSYYEETFLVGYSSTTIDDAAFTWGTLITASSTAWENYESTFPAGTKYVAIKLMSDDRFYLYIDDISMSTPSTCLKPTGLAAALTQGNGSVASLNWTEIGTATSWVIEYGTASDFTGAVSVTATTNPYNLTGLTAEQTYYARVKADCGGGDQSAWSTPCTFTPTDAYTITVNDGITINGYVPIRGSNVNEGIVSQFIIPAADLAAMRYGHIDKLTFYASQASVDWGVAQFEVYMTEVNETTLSSLADYSSMYLVKNAGTLSISGNQMEVTLDAPYQYMGDNLMIGFKQTVNGSWAISGWYGVEATGASMGGAPNNAWNPVEQRNFLPKTTFEFTPGTPPSCAKPTGLAVSYTGGITAEVSWTSDATAWNLDVNGAVTAITTNPYTLTGLTLGTDYEVKLQADCGTNGTSDWTAPASFTTDFCMPADQCELTFELTDSYGDGWSGNAIQVVDVLTGSVVGTLTNQNLNGTSGSGENELNILTLPVCDGRDIEFQWVKGSYPNEASWVILDINGEEITSGTGNNSMATGDVLATYTVNCTPPSCAKPTGLAVSYTGGITAEVSWTSDATAWNLDVNGAVTAITTNPYTLTGLTLGTDYEVKLQADCGTNGTSDWTAPASFTTDFCMPADQCELTFELTDSYGDGWSGNAIQVVDVLTGSVVGTLTNQNLNGTSGSGENELNILTLPVCDGRDIEFQWVKGSYPGEASWVIKDINGEEITSGTGNNSMATGDMLATYTVSCVVSSCRKPTDLAASGITNAAATLAWTENGTATNWVIEYGTVSDFTGATSVTAPTNPYTLTGLTAEQTYYVRMKADCGGGDESNWSSSTSFATLPVCFTPTGLTLASAAGPTLAELTWTENGDATAWVVAYKAASDADFTEVDAPTNPFTLTGLTAETDYTVKVRPVCDDAAIKWSGEMNFTTSVACPVPVGLNVDDISDVDANVTWVGYSDNYEVRYRPNLDQNQGFENGMGDWTTIDADGDGNTWESESSTNSHSGDNIVQSHSFKYGHGALHPDNWLVSPQVALGGSVSFYVRVYSSMYFAEHIGVYVSTTGNTNPTDFELVPGQEWTLDASNYYWSQFTVDLSAYSGDGYVAIRHFDCTDQMHVIIDDIVISEPSSTNPWITLPATDVTSATFSSLTPETAYEWQVRGTCGSVTTDWADARFTTLNTPEEISISAGRWYAIASPMHDVMETHETITNVDGLTDGRYDMFRYNEENSTWENQKAVGGATGFTTMDLLKGYIYRRSDDATLRFRGQHNGGDIESEYLYRYAAEATYKGFQLLGNPYPHALNFSSISTSSGSMAPGYYRLHANGSWIAQTGGTLAKGEAFLVQTTSSYAKLRFTDVPATKSTAPAALAFTVSNGNYSDVAYAMLHEGTGLAKMGHLEEGLPTLSIPVFGNDYAIALLGQEAEQFDMAFGGAEGTYTLIADNQLSLPYLHLIDRATGRDIDLLRERAYTFSHNGATQGEARFQVKLSPDGELADGTFAFQTVSEVIVRGEGLLQVFDAVGRRLFSQEVNAQTTLAKAQFPATGVYVLKLNEKAQKIVVK